MSAKGGPPVTSPFNRPRTLRQLQRAAPQITPKQALLIVCEDKKSAKLYIEELRAHLRLSVVTVEVRGQQDTGHTDPVGIVAYAVARREERAREAKISNAKVAFDEVYCVIDTDEHVPGRLANLKQAQPMARAKDVRLIISRPCFEIWYLMHDRYVARPYARYEALKADLKQILPEYEKSQSEFLRLRELIGCALRHAARLEEQRQATDQENPATDVHHLVKRLYELAGQDPPPCAHRPSDASSPKNIKKGSGVRKRRSKPRKPAGGS